MDLCGGFLWLFLGLAILAVIGHGIWVFFRLIFRALLGSPAPARTSDPIPEHCPGCGQPTHFAARTYCPSCFLDLHSDQARELIALQTASEQMTALVDAGLLRRAELEPVRQAITNRRRQLLGRPAARPEVPAPAAALPSREPQAAPVSVPIPALMLSPRAVEIAPDAEPENEPARVPTPAERLEAILADCRDLHDLLPTDRSQALEAYRQADVTALSSLSAATQQNLARLLEGFGMADDALRTYRRFMAGYPQSEAFSSAAVAAARLALRQDRREEAEWFLQRALAAGTLSETVRQEAAALLEPLKPREVREPQAAAVPDRELPVNDAEEPRETQAVGEARETQAAVVAPRRTWTEMLAGFMEEKNILWGEVLGGLLIVGCSIALVISLWSRLEQIPYFPFLIFGTITACLFGAGLYTLHHWKLESTSRGLLVIATLLVPLNFLVMAGLHRPATNQVIEVGITTASVALLGWLLSAAAAVLFPAGRWSMVLGIVGTSACQLLIAALLSGEQPAALIPLLLLGTVPAVCHVGSVGVELRRSAHLDPLDGPHGRGLLGMLGMASFSLAVVLGFLAFRSNEPLVALPRLALFVSVAGIPLLAGGLLVQRRLTGDQTEMLRTAATTVALIGLAVMVAAVALAWPNPGPVVLVGIVNFVVLTLLAFRWQIPLAHAAALPCLALAYLTAFHVIIGDLSGSPTSMQLLEALLASRSGTALAVLVVGMGATAWFITPIGRRADGTIYAIAAGIAALVSLSMVTIHGNDDPWRAAIIYILYGAGGLVLNFHFRRTDLSYVGLGLLIAGTLWGLGATVPANIPVWAVVLAAESLVLALCRAPGVRQSDESPLDDGSTNSRMFPLPAFLAEPLGQMAILTTVLAVAIVGAGSISSGRQWLDDPLHDLTMAILAATGFVLAWANREANWSWFGSSMVLFGLGHAIWFYAVGLTLQSQLLAALLAHATLAGLASAAIGKFGRASETAVASLREGEAPAEPRLREGEAPAEPRLREGEAPAEPQPTEIEERHAGRLSDEPSTARQEPRPPGPPSSYAGSLLPNVGLLFAEPLGQTALITSLFAACLLIFPERVAMISYTMFAAWLAVILLIVSVSRQSSPGFAGFQGVLVLAVCYGVTSWLIRQPWGMNPYPAGPRSLQAYGVGLAGLCLTWLLLRLAAGERGKAWDALTAEWTIIDALLPAALVVGQLGVAVWGLMPALMPELTPVRWLGPAAVPELQGFGGSAWLLLALLSALMLAALWRSMPGAVIGFVLLAVAVPVLAAGRFAPEQAVSPALRWGLAGCFLLCSALVWSRNALAIPAGQLRIRTDTDGNLPMVVRSMLLALCVLPILALTCFVTLAPLLGETMLKPIADTFFARLGPLGRHGIPLLVVAVALVGHALRERSAGYAFAAGLLLDWAVMGGQALRIVLSGGILGTADVVQILQLGSITAALWALAWLATRRWLFAWREDSAQVYRRFLMSLQIGLVLVGNGVLLVGGAAVLTLGVPVASAGLTAIAYPVSPWVAEAGSHLGWLALMLAVAAAAWRAWQLGRVTSSAMLGSTMLGAVMLLACSIERWAGPGWGYRTLMIGCGAAALGGVIVRAILAGTMRTDQGTPVAASESALTGVLTAGVLAVMLGLKAAIAHHDHLWAAGAILLATAAGAAIAVWRRQEAWAFVAGLGLNLAASLVVWHYFLASPLELWWHYLLQANSAATGAAALLWLAARKRFYGTLELRLNASPMLATQILLGFLGNLPVLGLAFVILLIAPDPGTTTMTYLASFGAAGGWLALLLPMAASLWYTAQATPRSWLPAAVVFALAAGILGACSVCPLDTGNWLAFHVLTAAWSTTGLLFLGFGLTGRALAEMQPADSNAPPLPGIGWLLAIPAEQIQRWVNIIGWLVVVLALRGAGVDRGGAFWSPAAALTVAVMAVGMALWARKPLYVYQSGLLFLLVANLTLRAFGPASDAAFIAVNILGLAFGSAFWSVLELAIRTNALAVNVRGRSLPFPHLTACLALVGLTWLVVLLLTAEMGHSPIFSAGGLTWAALGMTAVAVALTLWDPDLSLGGGGLYLLGLLAVILAVDAFDVSMSYFAGTITLLLAGYVLLTSAITRIAAWLNIERLLAMPQRSGEPASWLVPVQGLVAAIVLVLSLGLSLDLLHAAMPFAGPVSVAILLSAGVALAAWQTPSMSRAVRLATLTLLLVVLAECGWALLPAAQAMPWLHRHVILMAAMAVVSLLYAVDATRLPAEWATDARRLVPIFGTLAALQMLFTLGQEARLYNPLLKSAPTEPWAIAVIVLTMLGVIGTAIRLALATEPDPLGLPAHRRTLYVYAAEVLAALLFVHVRLTMPWLFGQHLAKYWTFIVMAIAFAGVGLAELFSRWRLPVLADPLRRTGIFLPILPVLAFWVQEPAQVLTQLAAGPMPGAVPILSYWAGLPREFDKYALIWVLTCLLYSILAMRRQSISCAAMAALAANFAVWCFWQHAGVSFLVHPQLWLIPMALIVLVAEHLNRERLAPSQCLTLRYVGLGMLYLSSTADMFIAGLGHSVWLPLVLMVLSVAGVLLGILLQVRAYLFLGTGFLFLVVFSMIWHAAVDLSQTWVWYVCGILLGVAILTLFAVFEKRRNDVLHMLEQLKQWR